MKVPFLIITFTTLVSYNFILATKLQDIEGIDTCSSGGGGGGGGSSSSSSSSNSNKSLYLHDHNILQYCKSITW